MIGTALNYIKKRLDDHLRTALDLETDGSTPERVIFIDGEKLEPLTIPQGTIGMLVANVQEEREFRDPDRYQRRFANGNGRPSERHHPDLHLEITVLFLANFKDGIHAWNQLSHLLFFFQENPVFDRAGDGDLPEGIGRLANELCSQSVQQQNELWSALKIALRPSLLYRFRLITLRGRAIEGKAVPIRKVETRLNPPEKQANLRSPPPPES